MTRTPNASRRRFLRGAASLGFAVAAFETFAKDEPLEEDDPVAIDVGYVKDANRADRSRFPSYRPGQSCAGCVWYQGMVEADAGPCQLFGDKLVMTRGWCRAWGNKPGPR